VTPVLVGYARCSTDKQDLDANRRIPLDLGVAAEQVYLDRAYSGTTAARPGDTQVVPKLDRLARSVPDARAIADSPVERRIRLQLGTTGYDPSDPMCKMSFIILATFGAA
jgi:DNA invertase Pin-like site-specific DNA recombinase